MNTPIRPEAPYRLHIPTRWKDNDIYGHVNNVVYYSYFDTVINTFLIRKAGLDIHHSNIIGLCAESHCRYLAPLAFPETITAHLRVEHLGKSSVRYGVSLFAETATTPAAEGWFVHVFVDRQSRRATPIPDAMRAALATLITEPSA
ncbi:thioesterase family protein [Sinimarinibacterium sp. NLF-5-8]|uniref:acyl-CoA thioesterase n=1 Tax=Sinimarinibacterium sp. NLF-5-8 TaxID=2698684 RepID=UPI00137C2F22|nr:thioesterase family protein [Sinimarinibacterium sp. NLF-5-8]QHS09264.1 acyl-CoA thioesterase [Sinimarinibacterium sp. NLF-5-8]